MTPSEKNHIDFLKSIRESIVDLASVQDVSKTLIEFDKSLTKEQAKLVIPKKRGELKDESSPISRSQYEAISKRD